MASTERSRDPERHALMSFGDHLDELRRRAMIALLPPIPIAIVAFFFAQQIRDVLNAPLHRALEANGQSPTLMALGVTETMGVDIKLSLIVAIIITAPWILFQIWKFVEPGLYEQERRFARFLVPGSALLVAAGIATLYFILLPLMLQVLVNYGLQPRGSSPPSLIEALPAGAVRIPILTESPTAAVAGQMWIKLPERMLSFAVPDADGKISVLTIPLTKDSAILQQYRLSEYTDFVLLLMLAIAIVFQLPLAILLLGWVGILRVETLRRKRRLALFILTIVAAAVTPTSDITSMLLMLAPLYLLYELGILLLVAAPPSAVSEGSMITGFFARLRSGKRPQQAAQSDRSARSAWPSASEADDRESSVRRSDDSSSGDAST